MYQLITIVGNLGRDPEMKYMPDGTAVTSFPLACNRRWSGGDETTWFQVTVWGAQAESVHEYMRRGRQVLVEGRLVPDKATGGPRVFTGNDGTPRSSFEVRANNVLFLGGRNDD